jgi:D-amino peptidase
VPSGERQALNASQSRIEIDFDHQARADQCLYIPGVSRAGERTVAYTAEDPLAFNSLFRAVMKASNIKFSP